MIAKPGGAVDLRYTDRSQVDEETAFKALSILGEKWARAVLDNLWKQPNKFTGATFTGCKEECDAMIRAMQGTGIEVEVLKEAYPRAMIKQMEELYRERG